jgi:hypothetical protein
MNTSQKTMIVILYIIVIYIFIHTYFYLDQLNNCECFNKNDKYAVNLEFMKWFQILEIFIFSIYVGFMLFIYKKNSNNKINNTFTGLLLSSISLALLLAISLYMGVNVINLYMNIKDDCKCANSNYKYFVYYEGILSMSSVLRFVSGIIVIFLVLLFNYLGR